LDNTNDPGFSSGSSDAPSSSISASKTKKLLYDYIPKTLNPKSKQHILVTTRNAKVGDNIANGEPSIEVLPLAPNEAKDLLQRKMGRKLDSQDGEVAKRLLQVLDYIPLAISQAATFMRQNKMTIKEYTNALEKDEKSLKDCLSTEFRDHRREEGFPNSIFRTWKLSFDWLRKEEPRAAELMSHVAMLDRQGIPENLLRGENDTDHDFRKAVGTLLSLSLITKQAEKAELSMNRLVRLSIHDWLEKDGQTLLEGRYIADALYLVTQRFPTDPSVKDYRLTCECLYPHAQAILHYVRKTASVGCLWMDTNLELKISEFDSRQGRYDVAHWRMSRVCDSHRKLAELLGRSDPHRFRCFSFLAFLLLCQGEYEAAQKTIQETLLTQNKIVGLRHTDVLYSGCNLSLALQAQGKHEMAEKARERARERALKIAEKSCRKEPPDIQQASTMTGVHLVPICREYRAAERVAQQVLREVENAVEAKDMLTLNTVRCLAVILRDLVRCQEAVKTLTRLPDGSYKLPGAEALDPTTSYSAAVLNAILEADGKREVAVGLFGRVLTIREKAQGPLHLDTLDSILGLAYLHDAKNDFPEASAYYQRAIAGYRKILGFDHDATVRCVQKFSSMKPREEREKQQNFRARQEGAAQEESRAQKSQVQGSQAQGNQAQGNQAVLRSDSWPTSQGSQTSEHRQGNPARREGGESPHGSVSGQESSLRQRSKSRETRGSRQGSESQQGMTTQKEPGRLITAQSHPHRPTRKSWMKCCSCPTLE
jgi:tetratricopeptide (TPR) repeat protein